MGQARHHGIGGFHDGLQFAWGVVAGQGRKIGLGARAQACAQLAHRPRRALHHQHHHQGNHGHQQGLLPQRLGQQAARQRVPQFQRFSHLDGGHAAAGFTGHRLQQHGHAHRLAAELGVIKAHQGGIHIGLPAIGPRAGHVLKARNHLAFEAGHAVEHAAAVVGLKGLQRAVGHGGAQARLAFGGGHFQQFADGLGRCQQGAVIGRVGRRQSLLVDGCGVDAHHRQHGRQDAQQQKAAQRMPGRGAQGVAQAPSFSR